MLIDILREIAVEDSLGSSVLNDEDVKRLTINRINRAAQEIYDSADLHGSLDEEVFAIAQNEHQLTFPWYVGKIRGARWFNSKEKINIDFQGNIYGYNCNNEPNFYLFREKSPVALFAHMENETRLTASVREALSLDVKIAISGSTDNGGHLSEELLLPAGSLNVTGLKSFIAPIRAITKDKLTTQDVHIADSDGREISMVPGPLYFACFQHLQILHNSGISFGDESSGVEFLFKKTYIPLENDYDCFLGENLYDGAIIWKYLEHRADDVEAAVAYSRKSDSVINKIMVTRDAGTRKKFQTSLGPYSRPPYRSRAQGYGFRY